MADVSSACQVVGFTTAISSGLYVGLLICAAFRLLLPLHRLRPSFGLWGEASFSLCETDSADVSAAASAGVVTSTVQAAGPGYKPEIAEYSGAVEFSWNPFYRLSSSG